MLLLAIFKGYHHHYRHRSLLTLIIIDIDHSRHRLLLTLIIIDINHYRHDHYHHHYRHGPAGLELERHTPHVPLD